ncbi:hypothetical protein MHB63_08960 [Bacillus sp. FSL H8-0547]
MSTICQKRFHGAVFRSLFSDGSWLPHANRSLQNLLSARQTVPFHSRNLLSAGSAGSLLASLAGSPVPSSSRRKAEAPVLLRQSDKKSPEKSGFDFLGDFVLTEELGAAAGQGVKFLPLQSTGFQLIFNFKDKNNSGLDLKHLLQRVQFFPVAPACAQFFRQYFLSTPVIDRFLTEQTDVDNFSQQESRYVDKFFKTIAPLRLI